MLNPIEFFKLMNITPLTITMFIILVYFMIKVMEKIKLKIKSHTSAQNWFGNSLMRDWGIDISNIDESSLDLKNRSSRDAYGIMHDITLRSYHENHLVFNKYILTFPSVISIILFYIIFFIVRWEYENY